MKYAAFTGPGPGYAHPVRTGRSGGEAKIHPAVPGGFGPGEDIGGQCSWLIRGALAERHPFVLDVPQQLGDLVDESAPSQRRGDLRSVPVVFTCGIRKMIRYSDEIPLPVEDLA